MKKLLLLATAALLGAGSMFGQLTPGVDPARYADTDGYTFSNRWLISRMISNPDAIAESFLGNAQSRTATVYNDIVYVAQSADAGAVLHRYEFATGKDLGDLALTLGGEPMTGTLCANNIGVDDYNHLYVCGYVADLNKAALQIYLVDTETGVLTALPAVDPAEAGDTGSGSAVRVDYIDVIGDLTGEECSATVMAACNTDNLAVLRAVREQGSDVFEGGFDGFFFWDVTAVTETCPMVTNTETGATTPQANWSYAPVAKMINDEEHLGESFYIDGFTTCPAIYNTTGAMTDSFNNCISLAPAAGTNGVSEFTIGDNNFVVWSVCQYDKTPGCTATVGTFGEGFDFADLKPLYTFPEAGLGNQSDGGTRGHSLVSKKFVDENNKEAVYILTFKCMNGFGVYVFAEEGFVDPGSVEGVEEDLSSAPAVYYNLQGQKIADPAAGLYLVKRGNKVTKELVK